MQDIQAITDKAAISLSVLCAIHCLALPLAVVFLPSAIALSLGDELIHQWMLAAVIPISAFALLMGCRKHQRYRLVIMGGVGLSVMVTAALAGHDLLGETGEKLLTVVGACVIALGHVWNYRLCQHQDKCECLGPSESTLG